MAPLGKSLKKVFRLYFMVLINVSYLVIKVSCLSRLTKVNKRPRHISQSHKAHHIKILSLNEN